jgi:acetyltransferase-like isoleucine patch superfamily enzyme
MRILECLYRSPLGRIMSSVANVVARLQKPFMVYGFKDVTSGKFHKFTRVSSTALIMSPQRISLGDNVWVWHYSILDATEGISIGEGCQIGAWVGIFTHGSENSIRLLGRQFVHVSNVDRVGYTRGAVVIGPYTFVGAGAIILPGTVIGKGCLISAGALVSGNIPDFSVVSGNPGTINNVRTVDLDRRYFRKNDFSDTYYDVDALTEIRARLTKKK